MTPLGQSPYYLALISSFIVLQNFLSGHSDLIAGAVITNNEALSEALAFNTKWYGQYVICSKIVGR